ncbi:heparan-alpha-glucosaminide N-acetyltransferase domain-containing protein [uncultured Serinicoccus sp.]|uniref:heparan-alpha-glucosaminide N-acetyltransferase domain-containing protein n=1 Tax=uncultured Serinicoccus sp. TaxID=735514 RepID=UPI00262B5FD1|nr:heparan-alpha-glucosaminide N-acetyltransferase domain-containing protein [uncultured Serinicoccus sp.]
MTTSRRLVGVDLARTLALLGMFAAHLAVQEGGGPGGVSWVFQLVAGRSSALFAVLAGVGIALAAPIAAVREDPRLHRRRLLVRSALIAAIGLVIGIPSSGIAVILTYYGVLFCCALPVLRWQARSLAWLALGWGLLSPVVSLLVRQVLPEPTLMVPSLASLLIAPLQMVVELLVTGYYPVLTWATYLFAGLAVGRWVQARGGADRTVVGSLLVGGAASAALALGVSALVLRSQQVRSALLDSVGLDAGSWAVLDADRRTGFYGTHPEGSAWWLGVWAPHSGSVVDLVHTTGTALLVLGGCLALVRLTRRLPWSVLAGAGRTTLTLYVAHVLILSTPLGDTGPLARDTTTGLVLHSVLALVAGALIVATGRRGPLERFLHETTHGTPARSPSTRS